MTGLYLTNNINFSLYKNIKQDILKSKQSRGIFSMSLFIVKKSDIASIKIEISKNETEIENLWRCFFNTIGIKERENKRCQMNFMPKKYWKNILEMRNE